MVPRPLNELNQRKPWAFKKHEIILDPRIPQSTSYLGQKSWTIKKQRAIPWWPSNSLSSFRWVELKKTLDILEKKNNLRLSELLVHIVPGPKISDDQ